MITKKSRYARARAFAPGPDGTLPFPGLRPRSIAPAEGVIEHQVQAGDRLDQLARHYYNDDRLWWRIVDANPEIFLGQSYLPPAALTPPATPADPLVHAPGVLLCDAMEGSVIVIPAKAKP